MGSLLHVADDLIDRSLPSLSLDCRLVDPPDLVLAGSRLLTNSAAFRT